MRKESSRLIRIVNGIRDPSPEARSRPLAMPTMPAPNQNSELLPYFFIFRLQCLVQKLVQSQNFFHPARQDEADGADRRFDPLWTALGFVFFCIAESMRSPRFPVYCLVSKLIL